MIRQEETYMEETGKMMSTEPAGLLLAMLALVNRRGCHADHVIGYRERSYNIGYCETCSEMVTSVRIFFAKEDGTESYYQCDYQGLAEMIRELTDDPMTASSWRDAATFEDEDDKWDRSEVHSFDEEAVQ